MSHPAQAGSRRWRGAIALLAGWIAADFFYHKHGHFGFEEWPGFQAALGFVGSLLLVLAATALRKLLLRDEGYYDD